MTTSPSAQPLTGLIPPVLTPLLDDDTIDEPAYRLLLDRLIAGGADGLFVGGSAGLGALLTEATWARAMEIALDHVGGRTPLLAGIMEASTPRALERIRILNSLGFGRFVLTPNFYFVPRTEAEFLAHFGACRDATSMEMVAYNIPPCTGSSIDVDTLIGMARRGWIRSCKDSSGDRTFFSELCIKGREVGLSVFQGNKPEFAWLHSLGAAGIVPIAANVAPVDLACAWRDRAAAPEIVAVHQTRIDAIWSSLVCGWDFLGRSIHVLAERGIGTGHLITPLQAPSPAVQAELRKLSAH